MHILLLLEEKFWYVIKNGWLDEVKSVCFCNTWPLAAVCVICSQLRYDGYVTAAQSVSHTIASYPPTSPSSRLSHLVQLGLKVEGEGT